MENQKYKNTKGRSVGIVVGFVHKNSIIKTIAAIVVANT